MNIERIKEKLTEIFELGRIVFWNDANADFKDDLSGCIPQGVTILYPDKVGQLKTKVMIELEKPQDKFLIYSEKEIPSYEKDWLLDVRLYSKQFFADSASMMVEELGLKYHQLRDHIAKRKRFLGSKERVERLKKILSPSDMEKDIDRKMLAVLSKADNDRFFDILLSLFNSFKAEDGLGAIPERFLDIQKMELEEGFWEMAREAFGYQPDKPQLRHLLTCLFISDLYNSIGTAIPEGVKQFILPGNFRDAAVFMNEWRDSLKMFLSYDHLSGMAAEATGIEKYIDKIPLDTLKNALTFFAVEKACASQLKDYLLTHKDTLDKDYFIGICRKRQNMHWADKRLGGGIILRDSLWGVYEAFISAAEFISKKLSFPQGFVYDKAKALFEAYTRDLYLFDRHYRLFYEHACDADAKGWDILKELKLMIEDLYNNWFLSPITMNWEEKLKVDRWSIDGVINQYDFFGRFPEPKAGDKSAAVFVIVSDALRYEAGAEISEALNGKFRFSAKKEGMLGVLPSYTALGMAALLPHTKISYSPKAEVLVDDKACSGIGQRGEILSAYKGIAIKGDELMRLGREEARELVRGKNIVYLYHNTIDSIGDDAKTEDKTFKAVRSAIDEVCDIVSFAVNNLHAKYLFVTADHGFVYTNTHTKEINRNSGISSDNNFIIFKKRYSLGKDIPVLDYVHQGLVSETSGVTPLGDMQFAIPKGMSLFNFIGGSRYFHGGRSLQEVIVPVITVEQIRGKEKEKTRDKSVGIQVLGQEHRITTGKHRFEILQIDAVSERIRPASFKIGIYADNELVSDIQSVTFESASQEMADRKKEVILTLKNINFTGGKVCRMVLRNADTDIEVQSIPVRIDRLFTNDF